MRRVPINLPLVLLTYVVSLSGELNLKPIWTKTENLNLYVYDIMIDSSGIYI